MIASRSRYLVAVLSLASAALLSNALVPVSAAQAAAPEPSSPEFYTAKVQPILKENCYRCHGGLVHRGGLNIETREGILKGGHHGPAVVAGDPANSLLVKLIRHEGPADDPMPMPPKKPKLSDDDIATVEQWVKAGAIMP